MGIQILPINLVVKYVASAAQPLVSGVNHITKSSQNAGRHDFGSRDSSYVFGQVRCDKTGTLNIYQGISDPLDPTNVIWTLVDSIAVAASAFAAGKWTTDGDGVRFRINVCGEVFKVDFTASAATSNFALAVWCQ